LLRVLRDSIVATRMKALIQQCPDCRTVTRAAIAYCDACGCKLPAKPVKKSSSRWKYRALAIAVGLAVALGNQFIHQFLRG
jgi:uncharacterized paraquat-inducible protein A